MRGTNKKKKRREQAAQQQNPDGQRTPRGRGSYTNTRLVKMPGTNRSLLYGKPTGFCLAVQQCYQPVQVLVLPRIQYSNQQLIRFFQRDSTQQNSYQLVKVQQIILILLVLGNSYQNYLIINRPETQTVLKDKTHWIQNMAKESHHRDLFIIGLETRTDLKDKAQSISLLVTYYLKSKQGSANRPS